MGHWPTLETPFVVEPRCGFVWICECKVVKVWKIQMSSIQSQEWRSCGGWQPWLFTIWEILKLQEIPRWKKEPICRCRETPNKDLSPRQLDFRGNVFAANCFRNVLLGVFWNVFMESGENRWEAGTGDDRGKCFLWQLLNLENMISFEYLTWHSIQLEQQWKIAFNRTTGLVNL